MISRRNLMGSLSLGALTLTAGCGSPRSLSPEAPAAALHARMRELMADYPRTPGLAAAMVRGDEVIWQGGFGKADLETGAAMTSQTILNVGSVTKTVTATAVLQLAEQGRLDLDRDGNDYLDFPLRNPSFPDVPIRIRDLLVHSSSILDDDRYARSYVCGDQQQPLRDWLASYFDGSTSAFHPWAPGTKSVLDGEDAYSNVAYGVLGHLVEIGSGMPYHRYFEERIFGPLGMKSSGFLLSDIDLGRHAVPYSTYAIIEDDLKGTSLEGHDPRTILPRSKQPLQERVDSDQLPHCLYSFGTPTDGLLRTSVLDLCRFLSLYIGRGETREKRILAPASIDIAFPESKAATTWWSYGKKGVPNGPVWFHTGGDPGITSVIAVQPAKNIGLVIMRNYADDNDLIEEVAISLLEAAPRL